MLKLLNPTKCFKIIPLNSEFCEAEDGAPVSIVVAEASWRLQT